MADRKLTQDAQDVKALTLQRPTNKIFTNIGAKSQRSAASNPDVNRDEMPDCSNQSPDSFHRDWMLDARFWINQERPVLHYNQPVTVKKICHTVSPSASRILQAAITEAMTRRS